MKKDFFQKDEVLRFDTSPHSPHMIIPELIRENSVVLDVGCNAGFLGKFLLKKHVVSDGIDIHKQALKKAGKYYRNVFLRDLYRPTLQLQNKIYDYIVFSDILEHLPRPDLVLKDAKKCLKPDGRVIISLPNIARFEIRLQLLLGEFSYKPGILGFDHLRFFTKKTAIDMIHWAGYEVIQTIPTGLGHRLKVFQALTAFQFIYVCQKKK